MRKRWCTQFYTLMNLLFNAGAGAGAKTKDERKKEK